MNVGNLLFFEERSEESWPRVTVPILYPGNAYEELSRRLMVRVTHRRVRPSPKGKDLN